MGSFSFTKADLYNTKVANFIPGQTMKVLIPAQYGGGFLEGTYDDYGILLVGDVEYNLKELQALWNPDAVMRHYGNKTVRECLPMEWVPVKPKDEYTEKVGLYGIEIGCYDDEIDALEFPLKLVSPSYKGTYEECPGRSYSDPNQGFSKLSWQVYDNCLVHARQLHLDI